MEDVRTLIPRTPPEGLERWEPVRGAVNAYGLVYEAVWVENWGLERYLDPLSRPRKVRMVEVSCSCCGERQLLHWAKTDPDRGSYGFIEPDDLPYADVGFSPVGSGDKIRCPFCGENVTVKKAAEIGGGHHVLAETSAMSAAVVGPQKYLVLTGWTIQRRLYRSGTVYDMVLPTEAYVFGPTGCAKLSGWRKGYSGTAGYFISYSREWRQPKKWNETWGEETAIYGLTPELIAQSCLPNCKLDVYMEQFRGMSKKFPVSWLMLYQAHPGAENLLLNGLPLVLDGLLEEYQRLRPEGRGVPELSEVDWTQARPAQMLGLTKEELRLGRKQGWCVFLWRLYLGAKRRGERLSTADLQAAFCLGDENILCLLEWGQVGKSLRYLLRQIELTGIQEWGEDEYGDPIQDAVIDASMLADYWLACRTLGRNLADPQVRWPRNLPEAHDNAIARRRRLKEQDKEKTLAGAFRIRRRQLARYIFEAEGLKIVPAYSQREMQKEADVLHHCVWTYAERYARGGTAIFFIRRTVEPGKPYYTLELDERSLTVKQNRGLRNCGRTPEVQAFEARWLAWVQAGARRDEHGKPVEPEPRNGQRQTA